MAPMGNTISQATKLWNKQFTCHGYAANQAVSEAEDQ